MWIEGLLLHTTTNQAQALQRCIGLAVDIGSSSIRCSAYVLRPGGKAPVAVPGTMRQVVRDALDPTTGTVDAIKVLAGVEAVLDGCLGYVRMYVYVGLMDVRPSTSSTKCMYTARSVPRG